MVMKVKLKNDRIVNGKEVKKNNEVEVDRATGYRWIARGMATKVEDKKDSSDSKKKDS